MSTDSEHPLSSVVDWAVVDSHSSFCWIFDNFVSVTSLGWH